MIIEIFNKIPVIVLLLLSATSVITGDYFAKYWSIHHRSIFFVFAILGYFFSGLFYIPTLLREGLVITSMLWSLLGIIGLLVIGLVIFKEHLTSLQIVGVVLGVIALIFLSTK